MNTSDHLKRLSRSCCLPLWLVSLVLMAGGPAFAADITFFGYSDCHYGAERRGEPPVTCRYHVEWMNNLPGMPWPEPFGGVVAEPKGVIMAGDLIDHGAVRDKHPKEWADYIAEFGVNGEGRIRFPVYEGLGNHDWNPDRIIFEHVKRRNQQRLKLGHISNVSDNGYHYSWDWDGIHFINLNIFPGNQWHGEADTYSPDSHHPEHARDFLKKDLRERIGDSGRPVIIVFHFRPIDENWWTFSAIDKFHRIIQDYNVILLMVGHQGGDVDNVWRGINWASSNGLVQAFRITPDNVFVAATREERQWGRLMRKKIYLSYETSGLPAVVNNGDWASNVTDHTATLSGKVLYQAEPGTEATFFWGTEDGGSDPDKWQHWKTVSVPAVGEPFTLDITGLEPWTQYHYRCRVRNAEGEAWAAASFPFVARGRLPQDWDTTFVGYEQRPWGGADEKDGVITVRGSGRDIGERGQHIDNFQYAFTAAEGDVVVQARLTGMEGKTRDPKAGIMLRESIDQDAASVAVLYSRRDGVRMFVRDKTDGLTQVSQAANDETPGWLKLVRRGDTFSGYRSDDGQNWTPVGEPVTAQMKSRITAGLAVTAGNRDGSRHQDATFEHVKVTQPTPE